MHLSAAGEFAAHTSFSPKVKLLISFPHPGFQFNPIGKPKSNDIAGLHGGNFFLEASGMLEFLV